MGSLVKCISLRSIPFQLGGACAAPKLKRVSPQDLWLWHFTNHPIFKIAILRRQRFFSPERRSKVIKFAKNDPLDALIVLARDEPFLFSPLKTIQRGDHWSIFFRSNPTILLVFQLFLACFQLHRVIPPQQTSIVVLPHKSGPVQVLRQHLSPRFSSASFWATKMLFRWKLVRI